MKQDGNDPEGAASLLTERQLMVLRLRREGRSQQEVAEILGTTRSNVSILEKRAHQNIARATRTLEEWRTIRAPISLKIPAGTDVFDVPSMIFDAADHKSIDLPVTSLDIIVQLRGKAPRIFRKRALLTDVEVYITEEGDLIIQNASV
jgi:Tfx family DNA-binding protein